MDSQRHFFLIIFALSCLALWFNWNSYEYKKLMTSVSSSANNVGLPTTPSFIDEVQIPQLTPQSSTLPISPAAPTTQTIIPPSTNKASWVKVDTPLYRVWISPQGMNLVKVELKKHLADDGKGDLVMMDSEGTYQYSVRTGLISDLTKPPNHLTTFKFDQQNYQLTDEKELVVSAIAEGDNGIVVTKSWVFYPDRYEITQRQRIENRSINPIQVSPYYLLTHNDHAPAGNNFAFSTFQGPAYYTNDRKYNKVTWSDVNKSPDKFRFSDNNGWVAMVQHYFVSAWILPKAMPREFFVHAENQPNLYSAGLVGQALAIPAGGQGETTANLYVGPQDQKTLSQLSDGLELVVDYGFLTIIAKPVFALMLWIHSVVGNWGWTIVLLTLVIKTVFFPLSAASYKSMAKMRKLTPKMIQLREMYANDKQKQQQELIKLYQTEKVNPLSGCLPIFVQIPVFLALYWVLLGSVEMRSAPWLGWITDLAKPDPYFILPAIMAVSMFIQTKLNPPPPDPLQAKMMTIMPIVFSVFFFFFPSGLVLYWVVNNVISIAQQQYNNKKYGEKTTH